MTQRIDILIFDDDRYLARMIEDALAGAGYSPKSFFDGRQALEAVSRLRPRLVVLDIMMPGLDGLALCRMIRMDPYLREVKIVILTTKQSPADESRARRFGADAYLRKPCDVVELTRLVSGLAGAPASRVAPSPTVRASVWGCRGPGRPAGPSAWGTHTSCVSLAGAGGAALILDAGSGAGPCAEAAFVAGGSREVSLLLTHYHPDHVEGLGQLARAAVEPVAVTVAGPTDPEVSLRDVLARAQEGSPGKARFEPKLLAEDSYPLGPGVTVAALHANHPTTTLAFSIEMDGKKVVYCPDNEVPEEESPENASQEERLRSFAFGADLLIHDARWDPVHFGAARGQGHSSWRGAVRLACAAAARRLLLFHLDASYGDAQLEAMQTEAVEEASGLSVALECRLAREGLVLEF